MIVVNHMSLLMLEALNTSVIWPFHSSKASCWSSACQSNFGGWNKSCPVAIMLIHFDPVWSTCQGLIHCDPLDESWSSLICSDPLWSTWRVMIQSDPLWSGLISLTSLMSSWSGLIHLMSCDPVWSALISVWSILICLTSQMHLTISTTHYRGLCMSNIRVLKEPRIRPFFW